MQNGEKQLGVCLLYTVQKMDAGPIIAQEVVDVDDGIQAHELLHHLFSVGTRSAFLYNPSCRMSGCHTFSFLVACMFELEGGSWAVSAHTLLPKAGDIDNCLMLHHLSCIGTALPVMLVLFISFETAATQGQ